MPGPEERPTKATGFVQSALRFPPAADVPVEPETGVRDFAVQDLATDITAQT